MDQLSKTRLFLVIREILNSPSFNFLLGFAFGVLLLAYVAEYVLIQATPQNPPEMGVTTGVPAQPTKPLPNGNQ